jgi:hypothetical protein
MSACVNVVVNALSALPVTLAPAPTNEPLASWTTAPADLAAEPTMIAFDPDNTPLAV